MTAIGDHCETIRSWLNFGSDTYNDALVTSWTRMAEEILSETLRCKHMVAISDGVVEAQRVLLPSDWLELDFVRVVGGTPLRFRSRDEFYADPDTLNNKNVGHYTLTGNYLIVGNDVTDGVNVELAYYQTIPALAATPNWLMNHYSRLYISATLSVAAAYSIEDERAMMWQSATKDFIDTINMRDTEAKTSGSLLVMPRRRGFG